MATKKTARAKSARKPAKAAAKGTAAKGSGKAAASSGSGKRGQAPARKTTAASGRKPAASAKRAAATVTRGSAAKKPATSAARPKPPLSAQARKELAGAHMRELLDAKNRRAAQTPAWQRIPHQDHPAPAAAPGISDEPPVTEQSPAIVPGERDRGGT